MCYVVVFNGKYWLKHEETMYNNFEMPVSFHDLLPDVYIDWKIYIISYQRSQESNDIYVLLIIILRFHVL